MARTTATLVRGIIKLSATLADSSLTPFIDSANELVTELCVPAAYTDTRLELIERWLAAHFVAINYPRRQSEQAGPVNATYQTRVELGLNVTHYGQQAMRLDTAGGLAAMNNSMLKKTRAGVQFFHAGEDPLEDDVP